MYLGTVIHTFNPNSLETEASGYLSSRSVWSMRGVLGHPGYPVRPYLKTIKQQNLLLFKKQEYALRKALRKPAELAFCRWEKNLFFFLTQSCLDIM